MVSSDLLIYIKELTNFLSTMTIKFTPFVHMINNTVIANGYPVDEYDPTTWKYYLNAYGEYHESDTIMYIRSLDTEETIPYTKESLSLHPKTKTAYNIGRTEYLNLCAAYPDQKDLIKSITYPVTDLESFIMADDFTVHAYGTGILESQEEDILINALINFITFFGERWYIEDLGYEDHYYTTLWASMWNLAVQQLCTTRISNMNTEYAHSFHVWEHLRSNGLSDYRDILTKRKASYLYKNIVYLQGNVGKQSNLDYLVQNLLGDLSVGMVSQTIYQSLDDTKDDAIWDPEILAIPVDEKDIANFPDGDPVTVYDMVNRLYTDGFDPNYGADYAAEMTDKIRYTTRNILPTKILEIKKYTIDNKYQGLLDRFIMDNLVLRINSGRYTGDVVFTEQQAGLSLRLSYKEALALLYYASVKSHRHSYVSTGSVYVDGEEIVQWTPTQFDEDISLPTKYMYAGVFRQNLDKNQIPEYINYYGNKYKIKNLIDVDGILNDIYLYPGAIASQTTMAEVLSKQFDVMIRHILLMRSGGSLLVNKAYRELYNSVMSTGMRTLHLSEYSSYADWILSAPGAVQETITYYNQLSDPVEAYDKLCAQIIKGLVPVTTEHFGAYATDSAANDTLYGRLKELFVQLCSYNILFLDTERNIPVWAFSARKLIVDEASSTYKHFLDTTTKYINIHQVNKITDIIKADLTEAHAAGEESTETFLLDVGSNISNIKHTAHHTLINRVNHDISHTSNLNRSARYPVGVLGAITTKQS